MASPAAAAAAPADAHTDLPKGVIKRIVKEKAPPEAAISKEALLAFGESAKVFISYITATANDICKEKRRSTISADDVLSALEDLEFEELLPPLREAFEAYKQSAKEKKERKAAETRKRKSAADEAAAGSGAGAAAGEARDEPADTRAASDKSGGDAGPPAAGGAAPAAGAGRDEEMHDADAADGGEQ